VKKTYRRSFDQIAQIVADTEQFFAAEHIASCG
jgi:hypothetical protein